MAERSVLSAEIRSRNDRELPPKVGSVNLVLWNRAERIRNAGKTFGMFFAFTCFAVLMPVIHYVLVPLLFITTFVMAMDKFGQEKYLEGGSGVCPKCGQVIDFQKSKFTNRITDSCRSCHDEVEVLIKF